MEYNLF